MIRIATIVKDEAHRYWRSAIEQWQDFADDIIVFDDDSTDDTKHIAENAGCDVFNLIDHTDMWGNEAPHRAALFLYAMGKADPGDVIFWLDADMVPIRDPTKFFTVENISAWAFKLYDLWGLNQDRRLLYRADDYWNAHNVPRVWAVRKPVDYDPASIQWNKRGIHAGHIPEEWFQREDFRVMLMPQDMSLLHYGYYTLRDREDRHERYLSVRHKLTPHELAHAQTILDQEPSLQVLTIPTLYQLTRHNEDPSWGGSPSRS